LAGIRGPLRDFLGIGFSVGDERYFPGWRHWSSAPTLDDNMGDIVVEDGDIFGD